MRKLAVTGVGAISNAGAGIVSLAGAAALRSRIAAYTGNLKEFTSAMSGKLRRSAAITLYAVTVVEEALRDRGAGRLSGYAPGDYALIAAITNGALIFSSDFHRALVAGEKETASPSIFSESVLNAPAGNASIIFNIRGPVHSIIGGPSAAIKALMLASSLVENGRAAAAIVVCAEERNELSSYCYSKLNPLRAGEFSEGAGALIIEPMDEHPPVNPVRCVISGYASYMLPGSPHGALHRAIDGALSMSGLTEGDICAAVTDDKTVPFFSEIPVLNFFDCFGHAFCVSTMWNIILSAIAFGDCPVTALFASELKKYGKHSEINHVIIYTAEAEGAAAAVILSKMEATTEYRNS